MEKIYKAKVLGNDSLTYLTLIKIDEDKLSFIRFGDSDTLELGEWVVAVRNPFNFASTVSKGFVSATARNINILNDQVQLNFLNKLILIVMKRWFI